MPDEPQSPEQDALFLAYRSAVDAQGFCTCYELTTDSDSGDGPETYECECGAFSGEYANWHVDEAALDAHLDDQEHQYLEFTRTWWAAHGEKAPPWIRSYLLDEH